MTIRTCLALIGCPVLLPFALGGALLLGACDGELSRTSPDRRGATEEAGAAREAGQSGEGAGDRGADPPADSAGLRFDGSSVPLVPTPPTIELGEVFVGQTRKAAVLLTNTGTAPLILTAISTQGSGLAAALEPTNPTPPQLPLALAPSKTTWVSVSFKPSQPGAVAGALVLSTSAGGRHVPVNAMAVELTDFADVTAFGARGDGAADDTAAFRAAAATGKIVKVPATAGKHYRLSGPIHITGPGVVGTGATRPLIRMVGANGAGIMSADGWGHVMFTMDDYAGTKPAIFSGLELDGGWDGVAVVQEWDHLIMLRNARNVTIENNVLRNPMGDCILLGGEGKLQPSRNITITGNVCINPWRCTVALIHVDSVTIENNDLQKPNGHVVNGVTWYHFNIDLEPNPNGYEQDWNVVVAYNHITARMHDGDANGVAVVLSHSPEGIPSGGAGGNVTVHDNSGQAPSGFFQPAGWCQPSQCPNLWSNVKAYRNPNPNGCYPPKGNCP